MPKVTAAKARARKSARVGKGAGAGARRRRTRERGALSAAVFRVKFILEEYAFASVAGAIVLLFVGGVVFWAGGYGAVAAKVADEASRGVARGAGLRVEKITLRGAHDLSHDEILAVVGSALGTSLPHLDVASMRGAVEELGWVRWASVGRLYPDTLHISVRERAPIAVWQVDGSVRLIDHEGAVIREIAAHEYAHLPMIVGDGAAAAAADVLGALEPRSKFAERVAAVVRIGDRRWNLRLRNGAKILLPETQAADAIDLVWRMHEKEGILDQSLEYIDLRDGERVIVRRNTGNDDAGADPSTN